MTSVQKLREICQKPVESLNDLPGRLYGNRISIHVTRLFLALSLSADTASTLMALSGVAGAILLAFGGVTAAVGFLLLETSYILDCVDGEIARYQGRTSVLAAAYDYLTHLLVKVTAFVCLGVGLYGELLQPWVLVAASAALLATLLQKFLWDLASMIFCRKLLLIPDRSQISRFLEEVGESDEAPNAPLHRPRSAIRRALGTARALLLNFDFALLLFLAAAIADVAGFRFAVAGFAFNAKAALLLVLAVALPLHFLDSLFTYLRRGHLYRDLRRLTERAREMGQPEARDGRPREARAARTG